MKKNFQLENKFKKYYLTDSLKEIAFCKAKNNKSKIFNKGFFNGCGNDIFTSNWIS